MARAWIGVLAALALFAQGCECASSPDLTDAAAVDVGVVDSGPPPQYCPEDVVRYLASSVLPARGGAGAVSLERHDVTLAVWRGGLVGGATDVPPYVIPYAIERATGIFDAMPSLASEFEEVPSDIAFLGSFHEGSSGTFLLYSPRSEPAAQLIRIVVTDEAGVLSAQVERIDWTPAGYVVVVGSEELITVDPPELVHWSWPRGGGIEPGPLPLDLSGRPQFVAVDAVRGSDARLYLAVTDLDHEGGDSSVDVFVLDASLGAVESRHQAIASSGPWMSPDPTQDGVVLLLEHESAPRELHRASVSGISHWLTLPSETLLSNSLQSAQVADDGIVLLLQGNDALGLARVRLDRPELEGGFRAILTGSCPSGTLSAPPQGGTLVVSTCLEPRGLDFTYFCVPDVLRE